MMSEYSGTRIMLMKKMEIFKKSEIILFNFKFHRFRPKKVWKKNQALIFYFLFIQEKLHPIRYKTHQSSSSQISKVDDKKLTNRNQSCK